MASKPTPAQLADILARTPGMTNEPALVAIVEYVEERCAIAVAEACGFHTASVLNERRRTAEATFVFRMEQASQETGP